MTEILETTLGEWVHRAVPDWSERKRSVAEARLGWRGVSVPSLQEMGDALGITRQSASEAERLLIGRLRSIDISSQVTIAEAIGVVDTRKPARVERMVQELAKAELTTGRITVAGLLRAADLAGLDHDLAVTGSYVHHKPGMAPPVRSTLGHIRKVCRAAGVCSLTSVLAEIEWAECWDSGDLAQDLEDEGIAVVLTFPWVAEPAKHSTRNALVNLVRRMLSISGHINVDEISVAIRRRVRAGRMPFSPPPRVIIAYFAKHPAFVVDEETVSSTTELRPEAELGATDLFLYQSLSTLPTGYCTRAALTAAAEAQGIGSHAVAYGLSYSPIVEHVGRNRWTLVGRGRPVDERILDETAAATSYGWDGSGRLVLTAIAISPATDRLRVPRAVRAYLPPGTYTCGGAASVVTVRVDDDYVKGITAAVPDQRIISGDAVNVVFDLSRRSCSVEVMERRT